ncbi:MAG: methyltransferase domain-containing protein [Deltaproteobacteria bacterium]|nr:methyltransferase domain-containing protein [Deltaproteobacteria bacterium]
MNPHQAATHEPPLTGVDTAAFSCPSCNGEKVSLFHRVEAFPVHSTLNMKTRQMALEYPRGRIHLGFCPQCGFISNVGFDPDLIHYSSQCEEPQWYSPTFTAFARSQASDLIDRYGLYGKDIMEIGCGKGDFLILLCELGNNRGVGFDPAYVDERNFSEARKRVTFITDYYTEKYRDYGADFICCRMTLEHIHSCGAFVRMLRASIGDRETTVFFQVPDVTRILRDCCFEDIYYEHCSYFSAGSLARLFRDCGFHVLDVRKAYGEQYLTLEARPADTSTNAARTFENDQALLAGFVGDFQERVRRKMERWRSLLSAFHRQGKRVVLWGSGSKAVAFTTCLGIQREVEYTVDINPYRQGTFLPGTGQPIVAPAFLCDYRPDVVVVMNAVYVTEIRGELDRLGLHPEILTLESPFRKENPQ